MLGKKSGVAAQIKLLQPKAVESHCQGHSLSLSVKDTKKASRLLGNVMGTVAEITTLVKYSPKREQLLGNVKENIEIEHGDNDVLDQVESLSKLCATCWTVRATTMRKVMTNYQRLFDLWDLCLEENLDRETRSRIVGCQSHSGFSTVSICRIQFTHLQIICQKLYRVKICQQSKENRSQ